MLIRARFVRTLVVKSDSKYFSVKAIVQKSSSHSAFNIPENVLDKLDRKLHLTENHPIFIIKKRIEKFCDLYASESKQTSFIKYDNLHPVVTKKNCFDDLRIEESHLSRRPTDTYYLDNELLLRTHTSAHQSTLITKSLTDTTNISSLGFLCTGDVYRRDEVDASHYPIFHQMEGVRIFTENDYHTTLQRVLNTEKTDYLPSCEWATEDMLKLTPVELVKSLTSVQCKHLIEFDLKCLLTKLCVHMFAGDHQIGDKAKLVRWNKDYFPFTEPSFETEVWFDSSKIDDSTAGGKWLEVLGCGVIHDDVINICLNRATTELKKDSKDILSGKVHGWAFGLGLERLAMILFNIPDIRLFWSLDPRFLTQFQNDSIVPFKPFSKYPICYKDMSFWLPNEKSESKNLIPYHQNEVFEIVRTVAGDLVEKMTLLSEFTHPKTNRKSEAYRIEYRSMERSLTNAEINDLQNEVRKVLVNQLGIELR